MSSDLHEWVGASFLVIVSLASAASYRRDHLQKQYDDGSRQRMASPSVFVWVYAYIRYTTLLAGTAALLWRSDLWLVMYRAPATIYVGMLLALVGFALFHASRRALGQHYSPCFDSYVPTAIVTTGPYQRIRHPIYTANQLILLGITVLSGSVWIAANLLLLSYYYTRSAISEERRLSVEHGDYPVYQSQTGRFLPKMFVRQDRKQPIQ